MAYSDLQGARKVESYLCALSGLEWKRSGRCSWYLEGCISIQPRLPWEKRAGVAGSKYVSQVCRWLQLCKSGDFLPSITRQDTHPRSPTTSFSFFQNSGKIYRSYGYMLSSFLYLLALYLCLFISLSFSFFSMWTSLTAAPHQVLPPSWSSIKWSLNYFYFCTIIYCPLWLSDCFTEQTVFPTS